MAHFYIYETKELSIRLSDSSALQDYDQVRVSIRQPGVKLDLDENELLIDEENGVISVYLTQEQTGLFHEGEAKVQVNIYYENSERDVTTKGVIEVRDNLYSEVMR